MSSLIRDLAVACLVCVGFLAICVFSGEATQYSLSLVMVLAIFAMGFALVFSVGGMMSLGHAAFFGVGSYVFALLTLNLDWGVAYALIAGAVAGAVLAAVFGLLVLRTSGVQMALTTLGLAELVHILIEVKLKNFTGGSDGLAGVPRPEWFGIDFSNNNAFSLLICGFFFLALMASAVLRHSPLGRVLQAGRQNPVRVGQMGYDLLSLKVVAFSISGLYSGLAGGLMGSLMMFVGPDSTRWNLSGDILIMTILGGTGSLFGPIVGVALFEVFKEVIGSYTKHWYGLLGLLFIVMTMMLPEGVMGLLRRLGHALAKAVPRRAKKLLPIQKQSLDQP